MASKSSAKSSADSDVVEGEVVSAGTDVAVRDDDELVLAEPDDDDWAEADKDWPHEFIEYRGDRLAVRKPTQQALVGFAVGSSRFVRAATQSNVLGLFIERHMSEASYDRMINRLLDPDDPDYTAKSVGAIVSKIVKLRTEKSAAPDDDDDDDDDDDAGGDSSD